MSEQVSISPEQLKSECVARFSSYCMLVQEDGWYVETHRKLADWLQTEYEKAEQSGVDCKCLIIMPRGSLKSSIVTKRFSEWLTLRLPEQRILIASNTLPNASRKVDDIRTTYETNEEFRGLWPELLPTQDSKWTSVSACVNRSKEFPESTYEAAGVKTRVTGRHYLGIIEDDTTAPDESDLAGDMPMPSPEDIAKAIMWHKLATALLVPHMPGVTRFRIVVTTRWGDEDLADYIMKNEKYAIFNMPAEQDGKYLFEPFYGKEQLEEIKEGIGSYLYSALYLNKPIPAGSRLFKEAWFREVTIEEIPEEYAYYVSVDPAISEQDSSCDTAIVGCCHHSPLVYVTDVVAEHLTPLELVSRTLDLVESRYEYARGILVETNAYQKSLVVTFRDQLARRRMAVPIIEVHNSRAKVERISGLQPLYEQGAIFHVKGINHKLRSQLLQFPHGKLVDVADALSMQLRVYKGARSIGVREKKPVLRQLTVGERLLAMSKARKRAGSLAELCGSKDYFPMIETGLGSQEDARILMAGRN